MEDISSGPTIKDAILILGSSNHARTQLLEGTNREAIIWGRLFRFPWIVTDLLYSY